jgi:hypothetical protein
MPGTWVLVVLALGSPAWSATHCFTYDGQTLDRLQTLCDYRTRTISTYSRSLDCVSELSGRGGVR